jgi:hypothetical protein
MKDEEQNKQTQQDVNRGENDMKRQESHQPRDQKQNRYCQPHVQPLLRAQRCRLCSQSDVKANAGFASTRVPHNLD